MARVALTSTPLAVDTIVADPAGTATVAGAGNGLQIAAAKDLTVLRVSNGTAGTGTVSVLAGTQPLANASGQGPLTATIAAAGVSWLGPFESARLIQADGSLIIESSVVMTVTAFTVAAH
jgi:hypothetical protein